MNADRKSGNATTLDEGARMHSSLATLRSEHRSILAVLGAMRHFAEEGLAGAAVPEPRVFRAMLFYVDRFAERVHHPKEERALFPLVRKRSQQAAAILDRLELEHSRGEGAIRGLEQAFMRWEEDGAPCWPAFAQRVSEFVTFYREHLRVEEQELVPFAMKVLTPDDWRQVDATFIEGADPLAAEDDERDLARLFTRVVTLTPAPYGVGEPVDKH